MEYRFPKCSFVLQDRITRQFRSRTADRAFAMAGLAIMCKQPRPSRRHTGQWTISRGTLRTRRFHGRQLVLKGRQLVRRAGVISPSEISHQQCRIVRGKVGAPMHHLLHRDRPAILRQPLLSDQVGGMAHRAAGEDQRGRLACQGRVDGSALLFLGRCDGKRAKHNQQHNECRERKAGGRWYQSHAATVTVKRSHPFQRNPPGFHGLVTGCSSPCASLARQRMAVGPRARACHTNCHCRQA